MLQPERARDEKFIAELRALQPDLIVVVAYGQILPPAILDLPRHGCLNVHASLLPKYRGAAPIQWAIANGDTETGVTLMKMDAGLDTGAHRFATRHAHSFRKTIRPRCTTGWRSSARNCWRRPFPIMSPGKSSRQPQPAAGVSHAAKIKKEDGRIDWNLPARTIWNRLRAFTPWPGAFTFLPKQWRACFGAFTAKAGEATKRFPQDAENLEGGSCRKVRWRSLSGRSFRAKAGGGFVGGQNWHGCGLRAKRAADSGIAA